MHALDKFQYCPACGRRRFKAQNEKSKRCSDCGFEFFLNPSSAVAAFILDPSEHRLLVVRRQKNPGKGTLDLPGGFCDMNETLEEAIAREVKEETNLDLIKATYAFSLPNRYLYSDFMVPTMDAFFYGSVADTASLKAADDAAEALWVPINELNPADFGLESIRKAIGKFISIHPKG